MSDQELAPTIWTTGWTSILETGTWRNQLPVHTWRPAPCHVNCPLGNDMPVWVGLVADEAYEDAWTALAGANPLPAVTGRVCHHPCENDCNRKAFEGAVGINSLEQYLGDMALEAGWGLPGPGTPQGKSVAIVGGGPAGLSAAYHLRRLGFAVEIYEARPALGGVLRYGIPEYRLPKSLLDQEIQRILDLGVAVHTGFSADAEAIERLAKEHDAVFLATGAPEAKSLEYLTAAGATSGLAFLGEVAEGKQPNLGNRVAVVGGGSAAFDVARTALRMNKAVSLIVLEERDAMLAQEDEVAEALEEGASIFNASMVQSIERGQSGEFLLRCVRVRLDGEAGPGVFNPVVQSGEDFELAVDSVLVAIGQDADLEAIRGVVDTVGSLVKVDEGQRTSRTSIYAGGDLATTNRYVSVAIGQGRRAAHEIARDLGVGEAEAMPHYSLADAVSADAINPYYFEAVEPTHRGTRTVTERLAGFGETRSGLGAAAAAQEAGRCLSCGTCIQCDNCFAFCSDLAVRPDPDSDVHYAVIKQYCKGCAICAVECPRGCIVMEQETE